MLLLDSKDKPCTLCGRLAVKGQFCNRSTKGHWPQRKAIESTALSMLHAATNISRRRVGAKVELTVTVQYILSICFPNVCSLYFQWH